MNNNIYNLITYDSYTTTFNNIIHNVVQYVDDSTNIISTNNNNTNELQKYIKNYYKLLEGYYNLNKLLINADKSKLLIICKPIYRNNVKNVVLLANQYIIQQSTKIKILGIFITSGLSNIATLNNIISKVNFRSSVLKGIFKNL